MGTIPYKETTTALPPPSEAEIAATAQAVTILEHGGFDRVQISERARSISEPHLAWFQNMNAQGRLNLPRRGSMAVGGWGMTMEIGLEQAGRLDAFNDSNIKKITVFSIARRLITLAILSHPLESPPTKIRLPPGRYKPQRREPTDQELAALQRANDHRHQEAQERRRATVSSRPRSKRPIVAPA
jgi:hypothetical protein